MPQGRDADQYARFQLVIESAPTGVIASIDAETVTCYAAMVEQYERAIAQLAEQGMTVTSPNGMLRTNPALRVQQDALSALQRTGKRLGLTASEPEPHEAQRHDARARVQPLQELHVNRVRRHRARLSLPSFPIRARLAGQRRASRNNPSSRGQ